MSESGTCERANRVGIVGAGPFGVGLAALLGRAGRDALLWSQRPEAVEEINCQRRSSAMPGLELPEPVRATSEVKDFAKQTRFLVIAVSSDTVCERLRILGDAVDGSHWAVHALGAFSAPEDARVSQLIAEQTPILRTGVIAGPSMAGDIAAGRGSSLVCASVFAEVTRECRRLLSVPRLMRLYRGHDVVGVELASALSGAFTIAVGLADALEVGIGTRAVLITRAVSEMSRLGVACGAEARTFAGLAGLGNLLVRTSVEGEHRSPSYCLGLSLVHGSEVEGKQAEGARAARAGLRLAQARSVRVPLLKTIVHVLDGHLSASEAADEILKTVAEEE